MKLKFALPQFLQLKGDPEPERVMHINDPQFRTNPDWTLIEKFHKKGLYKRAVVCHIVDEGTARYDPANWGIVVECHLTKAWPLEVRWANGKKTWTEGDDLFVIYRSVTSTDLEGMHAQRNAH